MDWLRLLVFVSLASALAVVPWLRQSPGTTPFNAIVANIALLILLALPVAGELTGAA